MRVVRPELKRARIEIIPMIDAIFFLLVFFMMTSLQMVHLAAQKVSLPESSVARDHFDENAKVVVTISREGEYYVDNDKVKVSEISGRVAEKIAHDPDHMTVIINCDRAQHMDQFARVFDLIKQANPARVMVATSPKPAAAPPAASSAA